MKLFKAGPFVGLLYSTNLFLGVHFNFQNAATVATPEATPLADPSANHPDLPVFSHWQRGE